MLTPKYLLIRIPFSNKRELLMSNPQFPTLDMEAIMAHALYCFYENSDYKGFSTGVIQDFVSSEVMESVFDDLMTDEQAVSLVEDPRMTNTGSLLVQLLDDFIHELINHVHMEFQSLNVADYYEFRYLYKGLLPGTTDTLVFQHEDMR